MKYITKFTDHAAYSAAESSLVEPNVSYCANENEVHYKPIPSTPQISLTWAVTTENVPIVVTNEGKILVGTGLGNPLYLRDDNGLIRLTNYSDNDTLGGWNYGQSQGIENTVYVPEGSIITFEVSGVVYTYQNYSITPTIV